MTRRIIHQYPEGLAVANVTPFPSSPQLVVMHDIFSHPRGQGVGWRSHVDRLHQLAADGYDAVICTVRSDNEAQRRIVRRAGWQEQGRFHSRQSNNEVTVWFRTLVDLPELVTSTSTDAE
jgi:RimJ/RimL family protein N-acetyltransferase